MTEPDRSAQWKSIERKRRTPASRERSRLALLTSLTIAGVFVIAVAIGVPAARKAECDGAKRADWPVSDARESAWSDSKWQQRTQLAAIIERCDTYAGAPMEAVTRHLGKPDWNSDTVSSEREFGYYTGMDTYALDSTRLSFTYDVDSRKVLDTSASHSD